ncbi:gamma-glutamyltransferase [Actinomadura soli]|uniref:Glutathione hydrolase proenzyme n=2 Tax=Actinomadura soli TaxID=2508997 RepID=A0A5C4J403_9ACTN|nr:gamma-glutamyltransferase [Actinomadura soli]
MLCTVTTVGLVAAPGGASARSGHAAAPTAVGYGGAVSSVDPDASRTAIDVLRRGGNAMDAAVAASAALGVTEPYVAGPGGGGFVVYYDAESRRVHTFDGRETAPRSMGEKAFIDPSTGRPLPFPEAVTSGLSVGVPGTLAQWDQLLRRFGTRDLGTLLQPAIGIAEGGFVVDQEFHAQTAANAARFRDIPPTRDLFLPGGRPPEVGSRLRNPDLAATYRTISKLGARWGYRGQLAEDVVNTVRRPPVQPGSERVVRPGLMTLDDVAAYRPQTRPPTRVSYRGLDVYGMAPPSSGGSTVGEALNILGDLPPAKGDAVQALHNYLEASRLAYADRNRYVGDPAHVDVPLKELLSPGFAKERACLVDPARAAVSPVPPGLPDGEYEPCARPSGRAGALPYEGPQTTNLVVADARGNVAVFTMTIEQLGGSGLTVPGRGFLLNNELTDFSFAPPANGAPDPNLPAGGKRPRSSMAPTLVVKDGRPLLAVGSPGGSTIITTVLQILVNRLDLGMDLPAAVAAPRATQRNTPATFAEQSFIDRYGAALRAKGHTVELFTEQGPDAVIGAATGLEFFGGGRIQAVAEPVRRHGGSAMVVRPGR